MKRLLTLIFAFLLLPISYAQVQYYGVETYIKDGRAFTKITVTFQKPVQEFEIAIKGKVENLIATTIGEGIGCGVKEVGISLISCKLNLTQEKRSIEISFETNDFVKKFGDKFLFNADFTLNQAIDSMFVSVKLPEGMALVEEKIPGRISFPQNSTIISDGRHIIVNWNLADLGENESLIFQLIYEPLVKEKHFPFLYLIGFAVAISLFSSLLLYFFYLKKPKELVLSVLDDFEKKVLNCIIEAGGEIKQKKIVKDTNISKAKVSRIIKSLEKRGLIDVKRVGRTNLIRLVKKKFEL